MLRMLKDLEGCAIAATDGDIGRVKDVYFDDQAWTIRYLVVETGSWLSSRKVLISPLSLRAPDWGASRLPASITRAQVEGSPDIDTDKPVSRQHEMSYLGYYGYPVYWGGAGMAGAGMVPMATFPGHAGLPGDAAEQAQAAEEGARQEGQRHREDDPHLRSARSVVGYHLQATNGELGHVDGFLFDEDTWCIRYLVVDTSNWWLGHQVLIAPEWISGVHWPDRTVTVDLSRESVRNAPPYDRLAELDRPREGDLYAHHGRTPYWLRGKKR